MTMNRNASTDMTLNSRPFWQEAIAVVAYPASLLFAITAFVWASAHGQPKWVSAYLPVIVCAALILPVLERISPHRRDWRPDWSEWFTDALYTFVIQIAMPPLLALLVVLGLSNLTQPYLHSSLWPHHWPLLAQGLLMVLLVDLMRYWLHRFAHTNPVLWRLHAVHHSPDKLYWLNTARFHPLEKVLHFCFDSIPFILLGVNEYVLAFYFVCYAVNGFYQHSNVYLRFGLLSYLFSTAELHRWHHSKTLVEANHNFSNTTILWDIVFGTYYRPHGRSMERAGIQNDRYPKHFSQQLLGPFIKNLESKEIFVPSLRQAVMNIPLWLGFAFINRTSWRKLEQASRSVAETQAQVLHGIMRQNQHTAFGQAHHFVEINTIADFQRLCPIQTYDSLRPYIDTQKNSGDFAITAETATFYAQTSGTTGAAKHLPVPPTMMKQIQHQQALAGFLQYRACPQAFRGALLGITGAATESKTTTGITIGAISGVMYVMLPWPMKRKFILPPEVFEIQDHLTKYLLILRLALAERDITYIATANPSTFVLLMELVHTHRDALLASIETGQWIAAHLLPDHVAKSVSQKLQPNQARASELRALFEARDRLVIRDLWPHVALLATWTGGNCRIPYQAIKAQLPESAMTMDLGLLASECRITLTDNAETRSGLPVFMDYFFEFVERTLWDEKRPEFLTLDRLKDENEYYLFVTTTGGLYRYDMNDIVKVAGYRNKLPLLEFLQKGRGVTNITGEKLYEKQVTKAASELVAHYALEISFYIVLADRVSGHYEFYFESSATLVQPEQEMASLLDTCLCQQNDEYKQKRASGRLEALRVRQLKPGSASLFRAHKVAQGQKDGQFKVQCLAYKDDVDFDFSSQFVPESRA